MTIPNHSTLRKIALTFLVLSLAACLVGATRNYFIRNPVGIVINLLTFAFLAAGFVAIWLDREKPSI